MKYTVRFSTSFKKSFKRCMKRGYDEKIFRQALEILMEYGKLPDKYKPHILHGDWNGFWECHLMPDWLLIWEQNEKELTLYFMDTGTHSDLFKM